MCRWLNKKGIAQQRAFFMSRILINSCFQTSENTHKETRFIIYRGALLSQLIGMQQRKNTSNIFICTWRVKIQSENELLDFVTALSTPSIPVLIIHLILYHIQCNTWEITIQFYHFDLWEFSLLNLWEGQINSLSFFATVSFSVLVFWFPSSVLNIL